MIEHILRDLEPFFYMRPISYVDVGAHHGKVFSEILKSELTVHEAHLIEPNPASFEVLRANIEAAAHNGRYHCHNLALGASKGKLRIRQAGTMSKVVDVSTLSSDEINNVFEADAFTLDNLATHFTIPNISLLKIDVEGYEEEVLQGAVHLLDTQAIDVIYIEAGMNHDNLQQCYYRKIEDLLLARRYRLFRIYEQHNEWLEDSPFLRRANFAFMSEKFARNNPYRLSKKLFSLSKKNEKTESELAALNKTVEALEAERRSLLTRIEVHVRNDSDYTNALNDLKAQLSEKPQLLERLNAAEQEVERLKRAMQSEKHKNSSLVADLERERSQAKLVDSQVKQHLSYRLGREIVVGTRSLKGILTLPYALWRVNRDFRRQSRPQQPTIKNAKKGKAKGSSRSGKKGASSNSEKAATAEAKAIAHVQELEVKLWGGFSRYAKPELEAILQRKIASNKARSAAAHALARWEYTFGNYALSSERIEEALALSSENLLEKSLCHVQSLIRVGRLDAAHEIAMRHLKSPTINIDMKLLCAQASRESARNRGLSASEVEDIYLKELNEVMAEAGLSALDKGDPNLPLSFSNLVSHPPKLAELNDEKVSVIVPAYNASSTLGTALKSLQSQTWTNLEIIVVDDCSNDDTCDIVEAFRRNDPRVKLVRRSTNGGAYPARNDGLAAATGSLITVHDSDDWSHPQKIERQMAVLEKNPQCLAVMSHWLRVGQDLEIIGSWRPKRSLMDVNLSSLIFRREIMEKVGGWDEVRVGGDAELRSRIVAAYGEKAICKTRQHEILSFALARDGSLTRATATHVRTLDYGLRWQYRDSYRYWHASFVEGGEPPQLLAADRYPVPLGNKRTSDERESFDIVVLCDFSLKGGAFVSTLNYIIAASRAGYKIGAVHWPKYDLKGGASLNPNFYRTCLEYSVSILTAGDAVKSRYVLVGYPAILQYLPDAFPEIETQEVLVLVNQFATRLVDGSDRQYDPAQARDHLAQLFGKEGIWIPISNWVKRLMTEDTTYTPPYPSPWCPLIDTQQWCAPQIRWRASERHRPVVGRHGRDAYTKWPANLDGLKAAYCVDEDVEVRFLGGAKRAITRLGRVPANWEVQTFNGAPVMEFIDDLDFFVHFPHEKYIEEFGRAPMEAMARGKVVILPPQFAETFGDAAVYCEAGEVASTIRRYWRDESAYVQQAERGRTFVYKECAQELFSDRLRMIGAFKPQNSAIDHGAPWLASTKSNIAATAAK